MYCHNFLVAVLISIITLSEFGGNVFGIRNQGSDGRRGEIESLPVWNPAPSARLTWRNKGEVADVDPRGSVRYNMGPHGHFLKGIITKHREVPIDDNGTGLEQAKEGCCYQNSYN